jgi:hypothetical protein
MFNNSKSSSKGPISRDRKVRSREPLLSDDRKSVQGLKKFRSCDFCAKWQPSQIIIFKLKQTKSSKRCSKSN